MFLLGYHGTSKAAATGLIIDGPKVSHAYAALGAGLYVARDCGFLVSFFSRVAQQRDSFKKSDYGEKGSSVGKIAKSTDGSIILKIYSTVPLPQLRKCRWDIMDISQYGISPLDTLNIYAQSITSLQGETMNVLYHGQSMSGQTLIVEKQHKSEEETQFKIPFPF